MKALPLFCVAVLCLPFALALTGCETVSTAVKSAEANRQPLDLYGLVVDQSGHPVAGVKVDGEVLLATGVDQGHDQGLPTVTDAHGRFVVHAHGINIGVTFEKAGYLYDQKLSALRPDNYFKSDPEHPVVFTMWKAQGAEPTIRGSRAYGLVPDGRVYTIDLVEGSKTEGDSNGGDFLITVQRPAALNPGEEFAWSFSLEAIGGGFIPTHDLYLNEAPANGYRKKIEVAVSPSGPAPWANDFSGTYYLQSRDGKVYGHIRIKVVPDSNGTAIFEIESLVNPAGSRDLETK